MCQNDFGFRLIDRPHIRRFNVPAMVEQIHFRGRSIVWSGAKEVAELKRDQIRSAGPDFYARKKDQIRSAGPDFYARKKVEFPLGVLIEPLPG
jgi:hypothetical protein